jgi:hypothetical protein
MPSRPLSKPTNRPVHAINAVKFRIGRVDKDWRELAAIVRLAADKPGYAGPGVELADQIAGDITRFKEAVSHWMLAEMLRQTSAKKLRGSWRAEILEAISRTAALR